MAFSSGRELGSTYGPELRFETEVLVSGTRFLRNCPLGAVRHMCLLATAWKRKHTNEISETGNKKSDLWAPHQHKNKKSAYSARVWLEIVNFLSKGGGVVIHFIFSWGSNACLTNDKDTEPRAIMTKSQAYCQRSLLSLALRSRRNVTAIENYKDQFYWHRY